MKRVLVVALAAACGNDVQPAAPDAPAGAADAAVDAPVMITDVTTDITADTTWSGIVKVDNDISIAAGVTLTVAPGTRIQIHAVGTITIAGTMTIAGVKGNLVTIENLVPADNWNAFSLSTGTLNMAFTRMTGGAIAITNTAHVTIRDSQLSTVTHDLLIASGGIIDVQYSWIGLDHGLVDSTHCDMHFEGGGPTITVSHSNISTSAYGLELLVGQNVDLRYNNWWGNGTDIYESVTPVTGDISFGWFAGTVPTYANLTKTNMATSQVADAGPRW